MTKQNSSLLCAGTVSRRLQEATLDGLQNLGGGDFGHIVVRTGRRSLGFMVPPETRCHALMLISQRREKTIDSAAEHRHGRHAEGSGNVHRTAVIAYEEVASREQCHHLSQLDLDWNDPADARERGAVPPRLDECQH